MSSCRRGARFRATGFWVTAALCLLALGGRACRADIQLSVDAKDGDKIGDVYTLVAHATSSADIDKVDFTIDDTLRYSDTSVPYSYDWDTVADKEGEHTVVIVAHDSNGATKQVTLKLIIDNGIGLGADALAKQAEDALKAKDLPTARRFSRRALKADSGNLAANRILASLYAADKNWAKAAETLEKANIPDDNSETLTQLSYYRLQLALLPENYGKFATGYAAARDAQIKAVAADLKKAKAAPAGESGPSGASAHIALGDALFAANQLHAAVEEYAKSGDPDSAPAEAIGRQALANLINNQPQEAQRLYRAMARQKRDDAAIRAVNGLALLRARQFTEALAAVAKDADANHPASLIVAAFADAGLGRRAEAIEKARAAATQVPNAGDAQFALAVLTTDSGEADKALSRAILLSPYQSGPVIAFATRSLLIKDAKTERFEQTLPILDMVRTNDPDDTLSRWYQALLYMQLERLPDADPVLNALLKADPKAVDVLVASAMYSRLSGKLDRELAFDEEVRRIVPELYVQLRALKTPLQAIYQFSFRLPYRTDAFLTPATLYPAKAEAAASH